MKNFQRLKTFAKNLRGMATDQVVTRSDFSLDHAPDWVFEVMNGGVPLAGGVSNEMEIPGLSRPADNVLMVAACLIARRNAVGKVPVRLSDSEGNVLQSGQLYDLFGQPNRDMTWGQYIRVLETHKSLYNFVAVGLVGQGDALVEPGELPSEMVPLSPANLSPVMGTHVPTGTPMIAYYRYADALTGAIVTYQPHQILVHRGFNPHAPLASLSPLNVLRRTMQGDIAAREQNLALQKNGSTPAGVLQADGPMRQEQAEEVVDFWEKRMKGYASRGKIAATWGGLKYQAIGLTPVEMEYINGLKFLRTDYFMIFRIPPEMVYESNPVSMGAGNQAKSSATIQWWEDEGLGELQLFSGLHKPVLDVFAGRGVARCCRSMRGMTRSERQAHSSWIARQEVAGNGEIELWFNENAIPCLVEHRLGKMSQAKDLLGMGYLPDDVNENLELGLPPHPDNKPRVASSVVVIGEEAAAGGTSKVESGTSEKETEPLLPAKPGTQDALERVEQLLIARAEKQTGDKKVLRSKYDKFLAPRVKAATRKISGFFVEQRGRVLSRAKEHGDLLVRTDSDTHATALIKAVFPRDQEDMHLVARLSPLWNQHLKDGADLLAEETGSNPMQIDSSPAFKQALENRKIQGAKINDTTEEALRGLMRDAFDSGDTMQQMADRIAQYYADNCIGEDAPRSLLIAQAQTAGIVNEGRMIAANEAGGLLKGWLHGGSAEPRPGHVRADQLYMAAPIPLDQKFEFQGGDGELYTCDQPGDSSLPASEVCGCSCMVTFVKAGVE